jgi:RNA polymerase-binding transcription factor DksA
VPGKTMLATLRASLEEERDQLRTQLRALGAGGAGLDFDENFADSGQVAAEQGESRVLAASLADQLTDVERALAKLEDGTYGKCEVCGDPIAEPRLEAMPATRFCIKHA